MNKAKRIDIRCTEEEFFMITERAKKLGYERSRYIIDKALDIDIVDYVYKNKLFDITHNLFIDVKGVSNNINQAVKRINSLAKIHKDTSEDVAILMKQNEQLLSLLKEIAINLKK